MQRRQARRLSELSHLQLRDFRGSRIFMDLERILPEGVRVGQHRAQAGRATTRAVYRSGRRHER